MKYIALIYIIFNVLIASSQDTLMNYTPSRAWAMCSDPSTVRFDSSKGFVCNGGQSKLYFLFKPTATIILGTTNTIRFMGYASASTTNPIPVTYRLFGPFNPGDDYGTLVENNMVAPMVVQTTAVDPQNLSVTFVGGKEYLLEVTAKSCSGRIAFDFRNYALRCAPSIDCESCIPKFQPADGRYVVTGWVKEQGGEAKTSYTNCKMKAIVGSVVTDIPVSGQIVDGWQRMEYTVTGNSAGNFAIELTSTNGECYFDDIRVIPYDGSMVSYVYDPVTMRLVAELDERNYAKVYEYDEEGKLIRVKKETEKGFMTVQETKENTSTKEGY